ncbi:MAG: hypothetical protein OEW15_11995 [Nitrospirota bacterium]|nr:hypothetical protein [Nitrospirota bacterium]
MDSELAMVLRNMILCGAIVSSVSFVQELSELAVLPLRKLLHLFQTCSQALKDRMRKRRTSDFWEIDMTKFEP